MKAFTLLLLWGCAHASTAELLELKEDTLSQIRGQAVVDLDLQAPRLTESSVNTNTVKLISSSPVPSAGITMDINLQLQIAEIQWVDSDGVGSNGMQGAVSMQGIKIGHIENGVLNSVPIRGVTLDVDGSKGMVMGVNQIGDQFGNGVDINIDSVQIN